MSTQALIGWAIAAIVIIGAGYYALTSSHSDSLQQGTSMTNQENAMASSTDQVMATTSDRAMATSSENMRDDTMMGASTSVDVKMTR